MYVCLCVVFMVYVCVLAPLAYRRVEELDKPQALGLLDWGTVPATVGASSRC